MKRTLLFVLAAIPLAFAPAYAADPANGKRLAERWCTSCHVVSPDQVRASADAPAFETLAHQPDFDGARLAFFLLAPHPPMPDMSLTRNEASDMAAYVQSLAPPK